MFRVLALFFLFVAVQANIFDLQFNDKTENEDQNNSIEKKTGEDETAVALFNDQSNDEIAADDNIFGEGQSGVVIRAKRYYGCGCGCCGCGSPAPVSMAPCGCGCCGCGYGK